MRSIRILFAFFLILMVSVPLNASYEGEVEESPYDVSPEKTSGWFIGSDQGVLFFVGDSSNWVGAQYYGTIFGGYNFQGYIQPMIRIGQAIGNLNGFYNPTTYFFIFEGGFRATPLRTKVRPYLLGTAGFYVLNFTQFGSLVESGVNFTFAGGGGLEVALGRSTISVGGSYRGFANGGPYLQGIEVTLGYKFQF